MVQTHFLNILRSCSSASCIREPGHSGGQIILIMPACNHYCHHQGGGGLRAGGDLGVDVIMMMIIGVDNL